MTSSRKRPLTDRQVKSLSKTTAVGGVPGLECVVSPGGARSWRLLFRIAGDAERRRRSLGLGRYPAVSLATARMRANDALGLAAEGLDPRVERQLQVARNDETLLGSITAYLGWCEDENARSTYEDKRSLLRTHVVPRLGKLPFRSVTRVMVAGLLDSMSGTPARKRAAYSYLHHMFEWAIERGLAEDNPCARIRAPKSATARHRILSDHEIAELFNAEGVYADMARISLLTAQRRGSISEMKWDDIDLQQGVWAIPARSMKSGKPHVVPLTEETKAIIKEQPRMQGQFVFGVGSNGSKPYGGASNGMEGLRRQLGPKAEWRFHDLRRSAVTLAQRGGASLEEITALTQHRIPGVIGVYARHAYEVEKRRVVELISSQLSLILGRRLEGGSRWHGGLSQG